MGETILSNQSVTSRNDEEGGTETEGAHTLGVMGGKFLLLWVESRGARAMGDGFYAASSWSAPSWR